MGEHDQTLSDNGETITRRKLKIFKIAQVLFFRCIMSTCSEFFMSGVRLSFEFNWGQWRSVDFGRESSICEGILHKLRILDQNRLSANAAN